MLVYECLESGKDSGMKSLKWWICRSERIGLFEIGSCRPSQKDSMRTFTHLQKIVETRRLIVRWRLPLVETFHFEANRDIRISGVKPTCRNVKNT